MIKKFYRNLGNTNVFFTKDMKLRTYAYGKRVHEDFVKWRKDFLLRWNNPIRNLFTIESGDPGANLAKLDSSAQIMASTEKDIVFCETKRYGLQPLWIEDMLLEVDDGVLNINFTSTEINLGTELKGWGISVVWIDKAPQYSLFVIGKPYKSELLSLSVYSIDKTGVNPVPKIVRELEQTVDKRSRLFCFGRHIFLIHKSRLDYFLYTPEENLLEVVGIESDDYNNEKPCCNNISSAIDVVVNSRGRVFWVSNNTIYSFPIGYPQALISIEPPKNTTIVKLQCYGEYLFVYGRSEITRGALCTRYVVNENEELESEPFNTASLSNIFFSEKNGALYYVKSCADSRKILIAKYIAGEERIIEQPSIAFTEKLFCFDGKLYSGVKYVGYSGKQLIAIKR